MTDYPKKSARLNKEKDSHPDWSEMFLYENKLSLDELILVADRMNPVVRHSDALHDNWYDMCLLGEQCIRWGLYGRGLQCFSKSLLCLERDFDSIRGFLKRLSLDKRGELFCMARTLFRYFESNQETGGCIIGNGKSKKQLLNASILETIKLIIKLDPRKDDFLLSVSGLAVCRDMHTRHHRALSPLIGESTIWAVVLEAISRIAEFDDPVLIVGSPGTGKELVARALHVCKHHNLHNFIPVNSLSITDELISSELFGSKKGAHSQAHIDNSGLCDEVGNGTLFLDEISKSSKRFQGTILRLLQQREYIPLGAKKTKPFKGRVVAACNLDIFEALQNGDLIPDLYARFEPFVICLPSLRERSEDILPLLMHFYQKYSSDNRAHAAGISFETMHRIKSIFLEINNQSDSSDHSRQESLSMNQKRYQCLFKNEVRGLESLMKLIVFTATPKIDTSALKRKKEKKEKVAITADSLHYLDFLQASSPQPSLPEYYPLPPVTPDILKVLDLKRARAITNKSTSNTAKLLGVSASEISQRIKRWAQE